MANTGIGKRLVRVLAESGNQDIAYEALAKVVFTSDRDRRFNQTWNPMGQQPDVLAIAPYIGPHDDAANFDQLRTTGTELSPLPKLDGAAPNIAVRYRANIDYCISQYVKKWAEVATAFGLPLIAYEGGQQLDTNAGSWSANPAIQAEYVYFLRQLQAAGIGLYCHYTLYGVYTPGEAWGLIAAPQGNPAAAYPKFRAIREWMGAFWGPGPY